MVLLQEHENKAIECLDDPLPLIHLCAGLLKMSAKVSNFGASGQKTDRADRSCIRSSKYEPSKLAVSLTSLAAGLTLFLAKHTSLMFPKGSISIAKFE
ncbi:hypothetical protein M9H77_19259 [Catharanthus roseus]|uniref:Uncharacterized protein n=1 Tax=Catharanthus roseus TaxID=4058 RepID=A0ACC0B9S7_CATRO|nr:hypothetical protein M9H77_19259 [Catharanthus roseus]